MAEENLTSGPGNVIAIKPLRYEAALYDTSRSGSGCAAQLDSTLLAMSDFDFGLEPSRLS